MFGQMWDHLIGKNFRTSDINSRLGKKAFSKQHSREFPKKFPNLNPVIKSLMDAQTQVKNIIIE